MAVDAPLVDTKHQRLKEILAGYGSVIVAYSGGVDSTLLAKVAHDVLDDKTLALTAVSASYSRADRDDAIRFARSIGIRHEFLNTEEVENEAYAENTSSRCYFCKEELFVKVDEYRKAHPGVRPRGLRPRDERFVGLPPRNGGGKKSRRKGAPRRSRAEQGRRAGAVASARTGELEQTGRTLPCFAGSPTGSG